MIPIHVINLERRLDRKEKLLVEFKKHNIENYTFYKAICGSTIDVLAMDSKKKQNRKMRAPEYACYLSHINVFESIMKSTEELHLVFEDDVYFVDGFNDKLKILLKEVENVPWDIFYLGINCYWWSCRQGKFVSKKHGIYYPKKKIWGTHAYVIKKETVSKLLEVMLPVESPIDVFLMHQDIKRLTLINTIAKVDNIDSDMQ